MGARLAKAEEAARLRGGGLTGIEVADRMGISRSYAYGLLNDPDGSRDRERKRRYGRSCLDCGRRTSGSDGRTDAPLRCAECSGRKQHEDAYWTRGRVVAAIREWARRHGAPPSASHWNTGAPTCMHAERAKGRFPATSVVQFVFGKWGDAIEAAGFPRPQPKGPPPGTLTPADYQRTVELVELHGMHRTAELLDMTVEGVRQRLKHVGIYKPQEERMATYTAGTAIDRDIEKAEAKRKALQAEMDELARYLDALKAAKGALNGSDRPAT